MPKELFEVPLSTETADLLVRDFSMPATIAFDITPSDSVPLAYTTRGIWVGGDGDVAVVTKANNTVTLTGALAGTIIPIRANYVKATGTTATNLVGLV